MDTPGPEGPPRLTWDQQVLALNRRLRGAGVPHAFGGAIALNYHRDPRSTLDIDINVFVDPGERAAVRRALAALPEEIGVEERLEALTREGQARLNWDGTFVDVFLADTDFHEAMASRTREEDFDGEQINVLSIEDLLICKVLFDRPKDWLDIEAVARVRAGQLDGDYMQTWLGRLLGPGDRRLARLRELVAG